MKNLLKKLWEDENFFLRALAVLCVLIGAGFSTGFIPTGVDGMGPKIDIVFQAMAVGLATGKWKFTQ